jgi:hypothetical protein
MNHDTHPLGILHQLNISKFVIQISLTCFSTPNCRQNWIECKSSSYVYSLFIHIQNGHGSLFIHIQNGYGPLFIHTSNAYGSLFIHIQNGYGSFFIHTLLEVGSMQLQYVIYITHWGHGWTNPEETCQQVITFGGWSEPWPRGAPHEGWMYGWMDGWQVVGKLFRV